MKKILLLTIFLLISFFTFSQTETTVWSECDTTNSPLNVFDTIAVPVTLNQITGIRTFCEPDSGQIDSWSIVGNPSFLKIEPYTGEVKIIDPDYFNNHANSEVVVAIRITDNGNPIRFDEANLHIVFENDAPVILPQTFSVKENEPNGFSIGNVTATDNNVNQTKTYAILFGNVDNTFTIDPLTGELTVADNTLLSKRSIKRYNLVVEVTDNGTGRLSSDAIITVNVIRVNKKPHIKPKKN